MLSSPWTCARIIYIIIHIVGIVNSGEHISTENKKIIILLHAPHAYYHGARESRAWISSDRCYKYRRPGTSARQRLSLDWPNSIIMFVEENRSVFKFPDFVFTLKSNFFVDHIRVNTTIKYYHIHTLHYTFT